MPSPVALCLYLFFLFLPTGPGGVETPAVSGLHPRSVTVTWITPSQPNGIITNYTLYLHPSSVSALDSSMTLNSSLGPNSSPAPSTEGRYLYTRHNLRPTSNLTTFSSSQLSISTVRAQTNNPFSGSRPGISQDYQNDSSRINNIRQGSGSNLFQYSESKTISNVNPSPSLFSSNPGYNSTSMNTDHFIKQDLFHRLSNSSSAASDSSSSPVSATVPGNTTSYTFLNLLPYHYYNLQVQYVALALW